MKNIYENNNKVKFTMTLLKGLDRNLVYEKKKDEQI